MLLFIVTHTQKNTLTVPITAPDLQTAQSSLDQLKTELHEPDLMLIPICEFHSLSDLLRLRVQPPSLFQKIRSYFNTSAVTDLRASQAKAEGASSHAPN